MSSEKRKHHANAPAGWRPPYLRRCVLALFMLVFGALIVATEVLLTVSDRKKGIATSSNNLTILWTFGPTAILTVLTAFWARVEYQTKLTAPWLHMSKSQDKRSSISAHKSLLLDYLSMWQPKAIWRAGKNRDYAVAASALVSMMLRILITVSTSLITLTPVVVFRNDVPVTLANAFVGDRAQFASKTYKSPTDRSMSLAAISVEGIISLNTSLSEGLTRKYAYQRVEHVSNVPPSTQLTTTVDAFESWLDCETASLDLTDFAMVPLGYEARFTLDNPSGDCRLSLDMYMGRQDWQWPGLNVPWHSAKWLAAGCGGSSDREDMRVGVFYVYMNTTQLGGEGEKETGAVGMPVFQPAPSSSASGASTDTDESTSTVTKLATSTSAAARTSTVTSFVTADASSRSSPSTSTLTLTRTVTPRLAPRANTTDEGCPEGASRCEGGQFFNATGNLLASRAMICKPNYNIHKMNLVRNGTRLELNNLNDTEAETTSTRQLDGIHAWDLAKAHIDSLDLTHWLDTMGINLYTDEIIIQGIKFLNATDGYVAVDSLRNERGFKDFVTGYWNQVSAILGHTALMQQKSTPSTGEAEILEDRLVVRSLAAHWMSIILAGSILLAVVIWASLPHDPILPRNPTSVAGLAALLSQSRELRASLADAGGLDTKSLTKVVESHEYEMHTNLIAKQLVIDKKEILATYDELETRPQENIKTHPLPLNPWSRLGSHLVLIVMIVVLEVLLRKSQNQDGLGSVDDETYMHYLWTLLPAVIFAAVGLYFAVVDFEMRCLAPYAHLVKGGNFSRTVGMDLLDKLSPQILWREIRSGSFAALAATFCVVLTSLLTIFSASLYRATTLPNVWSAELKLNGTIYPGMIDNGFKHGTVSQRTALILTGNLSYPPFTYEDLVFPRVELDDAAQTPIGLSKRANNSTDEDIVITATLRGMRSHLTCRSLDRTQIHLNYSNPGIGETNPDCRLQQPLGMRIDGENCLLDTSLQVSDVNVLLEKAASANTSSDVTYFGALMGKTIINSEQDFQQCEPNRQMVRTGWCSELVWIWGQFQTDSGQDDDDDVERWGLACNETLEVVDVDTTFQGTDLRIDPSTPPTVLGDAVSDSAIWHPFNGSINIYMTMANIQLPINILDSFFSLATLSRWAVPISYLGSQERVKDVENAVQFQHRLTRAQFINAGYRAPLNRSASEVRPEAQELVPDDNAFGATVTDPMARRRVLQDMVSTRVLQALLAATLVCSSLSWLLMPATDMLPRKITDIASVAALLADGNVLDFLPPGAAWLGMSHLAQYFGEGAVFRLGWVQVPGKESERFVIYVENGEEERNTSIESESVGEQHGQHRDNGGGNYYGMETPVSAQSEQRYEALRVPQHEPQGLVPVVDHDGVSQHTSEWTRVPGTDMDELALSPLTPTNSHGGPRY